MGKVFSFKHFKVDQTGCAMKINTDGVLLGATVLHEQPLQVLDIGTGTGVIALMLAQRFPLAQVDAVEIDDLAAATAGRNFADSPFAARTCVYATPFEKFSAVTRYDLIVSNPPYFVNDLKNPDKRKEIARHAGEDFFAALLRKSAAMLTDTGSLCLILPVKQSEDLITQAVLYQLFPVKVIKVYSDQSKEAFRQIVCLAFSGRKTEYEQIYIYESEGIYTQQYKSLLKDFFLAF